MKIEAREQSNVATLVEMFRESMGDRRQPSYEPLRYCPREGIGTPYMVNGNCSGCGCQTEERRMERIEFEKVTL